MCRKMDGFYQQPFGDSILDDYLSVRGLEQISLAVTRKSVEWKKKHGGRRNMGRRSGDLEQMWRLAFFLCWRNIQPDLLLLGGQIAKKFFLVWKKELERVRKKKIQFRFRRETSGRAMEGLLSQFLKKHNRAKIFSETKNTMLWREKEEGRNCKMDRNPGAPPLYAQLEQILKQQQIECGTYKKGDFLPTEKRLMEKYELSRVTVRQAMISIWYRAVTPVHGAASEQMLSTRKSKSRWKVSSASRKK